VLKGNDIPFNPRSKGHEASKFIIFFDIDYDWALGTKSEVGNINVKYERKEIESSDEGESPEWIIDFDKETAIKAGEHLQIEISRIKSSLPSGHANLYVRYENIPGYWDGTFVCTIEKSPILYKEGNVGIGTTTPQAKLSINGDLHVGGDSDPGDNNLLVDGTTTTNQLVVTGNVGIGKPKPASKLDVNGRIRDKTGFVMPVGTVVAYAGNKAPEGWLLCNGQQLTDLEKYGDLANALGESIPFNLPNYQEKFLVGANGTDEYQLGATGGSAFVALKMTEMPKHHHSGQTNPDGQHGHIEQETSRADNDDNDSTTQNICVKGTNYYRKYDGTISSKGSNHRHQFSTNPEGQGQPHENRPPFVALNYIIKY
jgi:microcystin-dependent protein